MSYDRRTETKPRTARDLLEDALEDSGSKAVIVTFSPKEMQVKLSGDYADLLMAKRACARIKVTVLPP